MPLFTLTPKYPKPALPAIRETVLPETLHDVPAEVREKARERQLFVAGVLAEKERSGKPWDICCTEIMLRDAEYYPILREGGKNGSSALTYSNFRRWVSLLGRDNRGNIRLDHITALCDQYTRGDRPVKGDDVFWEVLKGLYLNPNRLSLRECYIRTEQKIRRDFPLAVIPSYHQAKRQIHKIPHHVLILGRYGEEALKNKCIDFIRRDWSDVAPGEVLIGDNRTLDIFIKVPDGKGGWRAARPTVCALMDGRSWKIAGWQMTADPVNADTILQTLALAVHEMGNRAPKYLYFDNGKDFCAQGVSTPLTVGEYEHSVIKELGIKLINSEAYNAKAKTIERYFRDMMMSFDKLYPAYLGSKPADRPGEAAYFSGNPVSLPSLHEITRLLGAWMEEQETTPKNGKIHAGESPAEIWARRDMNAPSFEPSYLIKAFQRPMDVRQVHRGPAVSLGKVEYFADELRPYEGKGKAILVKADVCDRSHVYAYTLDGTYICECRTRELIRAINASPEAIAELKAHQYRQLRETYTALREMTGGLHVLAPAQILFGDLSQGISEEGRRRSVKGSSHLFTHHVPTADKAALPASEAVDESVLDFTADKDVTAALEAALGASAAADEDPAGLPPVPEIESPTALDEEELVVPAFL